MSDPISRLWADAYMAKYANPAAPATAAERLAGDMAEARAAALARALDALSRGVEPPEADVEPLRSDPDAHLRYLDARDEALALHGGELRWQPGP